VTKEGSEAIRRRNEGGGGGRAGGGEEPSEAGVAGLLQQMDDLAIGRGDSCVGGGLTDAAVKTASGGWGCRLEMAGGRSSLMDRDGHPLEPAASPSDDTNCKGNYFPGVIPWENADSPTPRFVVDVPQEGLARQLRLCGIDTLSSPIFSKAERYKAYRFMVESASDGGRVILTCDKLFFARKLSRQAFFVAGKDKQAQVLTQCHRELFETAALPPPPLQPQERRARFADPSKCTTEIGVIDPASVGETATSTGLTDCWLAAAR